MDGTQCEGRQRRMHMDTSGPAVLLGDGSAIVDDDAEETHELVGSETRAGAIVLIICLPRRCHSS
jgi:hypothetical protein